MTAYTVVDPRAVVVHFVDTFFAGTTMVASVGFVLVTGLTEPYVLDWDLFGDWDWRGVAWVHCHAFCVAYHRH